jgi:hypothetical protein
LDLNKIKFYDLWFTALNANPKATNIKANKGPTIDCLNHKTYMIF